MLRPLLTTVLRSGTCYQKIYSLRTPLTVRWSHDEPPRAFDNLPFSVPNRYAATLVFSIMFGVGLWAPYAIMWYSMAKNTL